MSTAKLLEHLKSLSNRDRLAVIEAATRLIRADLGAPAAADDPILQVAGCLSGKALSATEIEKDLYGPEPG